MSTLRQSPQLCRCLAAGVPWGLSFVATSKGTGSLQNQSPCPRAGPICAAAFCVSLQKSSDSLHRSQSRSWAKPGCGLGRHNTQRQLCLLYPTDVTACKENIVLHCCSCLLEIIVQIHWIYTKITWQCLWKGRKSISWETLMQLQQEIAWFTRSR